MFIGRKICPDSLSNIVAHFTEQLVREGLQPGAVARIDADRARGALLVMATAAPHFYAGNIGAKIGFDAVIATRHIGEVSGQLTHRIDGENCYADEKLRRVQEWLSQQGIDRQDAHIRFYSDDLSDRFTLNFADEGYAVNPSKHFMKAAAEANWGVLDFRSAQATASAS
jgi:HAD superfamily phosphoserine phosphatase-like hydrolase